MPAPVSVIVFPAIVAGPDLTRISGVFPELTLGGVMAKEGVPKIFVPMEVNGLIDCAAFLMTN